MANTSDELELALRRLIEQCEASGVTQIHAGSDRPDLERLRRRIDEAKTALREVTR